MEINNYPNYLIYEDGGVWSKPRRKTKGGFYQKLDGVAINHIKVTYVDAGTVTSTCLFN